MVLSTKPPTKWNPGYANAQQSPLWKQVIFSRASRFQHGVPNSQNKVATTHQSQSTLFIAAFRVKSTTQYVYICYVQVYKNSRKIFDRVLQRNEKFVAHFSQVSDRFQKEKKVFLGCPGGEKKSSAPPRTRVWGPLTNRPSTKIPARNFSFPRTKAKEKKKLVCFCTPATGVRGNKRKREWRQQQGATLTHNHTSRSSSTSQARWSILYICLESSYI